MKTEVCNHSGKILNQLNLVLGVVAAVMVSAFLYQYVGTYRIPEQTGPDNMQINQVENDRIASHQRAHR